MPHTLTNAVVTWPTLAHISPAHSENINFFGAIGVDIEGELAQLGPTGYRRHPLLTPDSSAGDYHR